MRISDRRALSVLLVILTVLCLGAPAGAVTLPGAACDSVDLERNLADDPFPIATAQSCPGIRPGAVHSVDGAGCTFNFVFRGTRVAPDGTSVDEGLFIGTAGHCVFDDASADTVFPPGEGKVVTDREGARVGEVVYGVDEGPLDFGLIRIDAARADDVNPAMCHFGGPVAMGGNLPAGTLVHHFGGGLGFGDTVPGRTGRAAGYYDDGTVLSFTGAALFGDSGSGVIDENGKAVGVLVRLATGTAGGNTDATDLPYHVARASQHLGINLELQTAPFV